ncbi:ParB N-terminal domain-containing protein [Natrialba swarupiae]|uniref:Uncharacterized protein n=1 Tax=Natrialba swarupiae TaxID=2448032 RepID=A0A5D5AJF6_9EURY|nr:hypothetical protein [Natrialba swarupiae]TYT62008.1 hypothetical protein FYC77_11085 [Natrialba swarupiae]
MSDEIRERERSWFDRIRIFVMGELEKRHWYNRLENKHIAVTNNSIDIDLLKVVRVDPDEIKFVAGTITPGGPDSYHLEYLERPAPFGRESIGAVRGGDWDRTGVRFDSLSEFTAIESHFEAGVPWSDTELYKRHEESIDDGYSSYGVRSIEGLDHKFEQLDELFHSVSKHGLRSQQELGKSCLAEVGIALGRDGRPLFFGEGRHRLSIAKVLGLESVPVLIHLRHRNLLYGSCALENR